MPPVRPKDPPINGGAHDVPSAPGRAIKVTKLSIRNSEAFVNRGQTPLRWFMVLIRKGRAEAGLLPRPLPAGTKAPIRRHEAGKHRCDQLHGLHGALPRLAAKDLPVADQAAMHCRREFHRQPDRLVGSVSICENWRALERDALIERSARPRRRPALTLE